MKLASIAIWRPVKIFLKLAEKLLVFRVKLWEKIAKRPISLDSAHIKNIKIARHLVKSG